MLPFCTVSTPCFCCSSCIISSHICFLFLFLFAFFFFRVFHYSMLSTPPGVDNNIYLSHKLLSAFSLLFLRRIFWYLNLIFFCFLLVFFYFLLLCTFMHDLDLFSFLSMT